MTELLAQLPNPFANGQTTDKHPFDQFITEAQENRPKISVFQPQSLEGWTGNQYGVMDRLEQSDRISQLLPFIASHLSFTSDKEGFVELREEQPTETSFDQLTSPERTLSQESTRTIIEKVSEKEPASTTEKLGLLIVNSETSKLESITVNPTRLEASEQIENNQLSETLIYSNIENNLGTNQVTISTESDFISVTGLNNKNELVNAEVNSNLSISQKSDNSEISAFFQTSSPALSTTPQDNSNISIENQSNVSELIDWSQPLEDAVPLQVSKSGQLNLSSTNPTLINPNPKISKNSVAPQPANSIDSPTTINSEDFSSTDDRPLAAPEISASPNSSTSFDESSVSQENNNPNNNREPSKSTSIRTEISADVAQLSQSIANHQETLEIKPVTPMVHPLEALSFIQSPEESNIENPISSQQSLTTVNPLTQNVIDESVVSIERTIQTSMALDQSQPPITTNKEKSLEIVQPDPVVTNNSFYSTVTPSVSNDNKTFVDSHPSVPKESVVAKESKPKTLSEFSILSPEESSLSRGSIVEPQLLEENKSEVSVTSINIDDIGYLTPTEPQKKKEISRLIQQEITIKEQNASVNQDFDHESSAPEEPQRSPSSPSESLINQIFPIKTFAKAITDLIQPLSHLSNDLINTQLEVQSTENIVAKNNDSIPSQQSALDELSASNENDRREPSKSTSIRTEISADVAQLSQSMENQQEILEIKPVAPLVRSLEALSSIQSPENSNIENPISPQQNLQITTNKEKSLEIVQPDPVVTNNSFYSTVTPSVSNDKKTSVDSPPSVPKESVVGKESKPKALSEFSSLSPEKSSLSRGSVIEPKLLQKSKSKVSVTPIDIQHLAPIEPKEKQEVNLLIQQEITTKEQNTSMSQNSDPESSAPEEPRRSPSHSSQSLINQIFPIRTLSKTIADPIKPLPGLPKDSNNIKSKVNPIENIIEEKNLILENAVFPRQIEQSLAIAPQTPINPIMPVSRIQREVIPSSETSQRIVVTIGHIDVKVTQSNSLNKPNPQPPSPAPSGPRLSLAEYLRRQNHPERGQS